MDNKAPKYYYYYEIGLGNIVNEAIRVKHPGFKEELTLTKKIARINNHLKDNENNRDWFYAIWDPYLSKEELKKPHIGFKQYMLARRLADQPEVGLINDKDIGSIGITLSSEYDRELRLFNSRPNIKEVPKEGIRTFYTNILDQPEQTTEEHHKGILFVTSNLESLTTRMKKLNWSMSFFNPKTPNKVKISKNMRKQNQGRIIQFSHWCSTNYISDANEIHNIAIA